MSNAYPFVLLDSAGASVDGDGFQLKHTSKDFTFAMSGSASTGSAYVDGSLDGVQWFTIGLLYIAPASATVLYSTDKPYEWIRARSNSDVSGGTVTVKAVHI
jgi:hypothetical protein